MRKVSIFVLSAVIITGFIFSVQAGHVPMLYPYEGVLYGYTSSMPIPAGGDLRQHIIGQNPYKKWELWPGRSKLMKGTEPHGTLLTVYVNDIASESINSGRGLDNNSIIIKENYDKKKELTAVSVMYKVKGYNPGKGDWFWVQYDPDFNILLEGKAEKCIACHTRAKGSDYVFSAE